MGPRTGEATRPSILQGIVEARSVNNTRYEEYKTHTRWRKTRGLSDDVVPRGEQGTRDGKDETVTGIGTEAGLSTSAEVGTRTGARAGTRTERRVKGRESLGTFEVVIDVGRKTRKGKRRQRVISNHSRKT